MMRPRRVPRDYALLSALYLASRALLHVMGLRYAFSVDWMFLADPADLRDRLTETLYFFHAFPPGINAVTGLILALGGDHAATIARTLFLILGLVLVNALFYLGRAIGLSIGAAFLLALGFALAPATIYFEHLYHYEWLVITMLASAAVLWHRGLVKPSFAAWLGCFSLAAAVCLTRSTFHLGWLALVAAMAAWLSRRPARRLVLAAAVPPAAMVTAVYLKNLLLFGVFAISSFGPASYSLVTVDRLPDDVRDAWMAGGHLSTFAAMSVYSPPRDYARFFATPEREGWPPQVTRLEHRTVKAANFNHWWLLEVHRARLDDVRYYLATRPLDYSTNVARGIRDLFGPSTTWHPRDGTAGSPHSQHRAVLGGYEHWFNRAVHSLPVQPFGFYVLLPPVLLWAAVHARGLMSSPHLTTRARGALIVFCIFQIVYVVTVSSMLTYLESSRYRFQVEWAIWLLTAAAASALTTRIRSRARLTLR